VRVSELLGLRVRTESGDRLGRVHDVRAELTSSSLRVTGLVVGSLGIVERLGIARPHDVVPWSAVLRADRRGVVVRDGTTPK
jgi:sporulation protein YlmC with PRC-barrel domain